MAREILFKAKRIDNGEWVEGYYVKGKETPSVIFTNIDSYIPECFELEEIDENTLCQFTGLTDKNGNKIWENDVVSCGGNLVVSWKENLASFCLSKKGWMHQHFFGEAVEGCDCEVIGNIFDNPELIGGAE